jgi:hypothetical protein
MAELPRSRNCRPGRVSALRRAANSWPAHRYGRRSVLSVRRVGLSPRLGPAAGTTRSIRTQDWTARTGLSGSVTMRVSQTTVRDALVLVALCLFIIWLILQIWNLGHL